jgi:hypothetical protein
MPALPANIAVATSFRVGDELRDGLGGYRGMDGDEEGVLAEEGDGCEIREYVVGWLLAHVRHDCQGTVGAEEKRVAVRGRSLHLDGGERAVGARLGDDDDRLAERLAQLVANDAREIVGGRARPERDHEPDGLGGIGLRVRCGLRQQRQNGCQDGSSKPSHEHAPWTLFWKL